MPCKSWNLFKICSAWLESSLVGDAEGKAFFCRCATTHRIHTSTTMSVQSTKRCFTCCRTPANFGTSMHASLTDWAGLVAGWLVVSHSSDPGVRPIDRRPAASVHRDLPGDGCYHCRHRQYRTAAAHVLLARANADAEEQEYTCSVCGTVWSSIYQSTVEQQQIAMLSTLSLRCVWGVAGRQAERADVCSGNRSGAVPQFVSFFLCALPVAVAVGVG